MKQQSPVSAPSEAPTNNKVPPTITPPPVAAPAAPQPSANKLTAITDRLQRLTKQQKLLGLLGALVAVLLVILAFGLGDDNTIDTNGSMAGGHDVNVTVPGAAPVLAPHPTGSATLGGKLDPFAATYGKPVEAFSGNATFVSKISGSNVRIFVSLASGKDGTEHVVGVHLAPVTGMWDIATATTIATAFLPNDAHFVQAATTPDGVYYHIYQSGSLAQSLSAASFMSPNQQHGTAGTIAWYCDLNQAFCYVGTIAP